MKLVDENGIEFVSEAAPMLPFSNETNADVINSLSKLLSTTIQLNSAPDNIPPSVKYGIEQAFLYKSIQEGNSLINLTIPKKIFVNSLFSLNEKLESEFGGTIKIKIGNDFSNKLELIKKLPKKTKIRLDVNGAWDLGTAKKYLEILSAIENIEYIEDPCPSLEDNIKLSAEKLVKIAIDQECRSIDDIKKLEKIDEIDFLILKPALSGSLFELSEIIRNSPKKIIITSAFESYITRHSLILLASLLEHNYAHGLSTGTFLSNDTCKELYPLIDGEILLDSIIYPKDLSIKVK